MSIARYLSKLGTLLNSSGQVPAAGIADGAVTAAKLAPGVGAAPVDVQTFDSTGTWTKPTGGQTMARIQMWGGGGGGGSYSGGGGGAYNEIVTPISLVNTQTATVGAGGAPSTTTGSAGGATSFVVAGVTRYAYGGGGGGNSNYGGQGGTPLAAGVSGSATGSGDFQPYPSFWQGGKGNGAGCTGYGNASIFGGGGGAGQLGGAYASSYGGNGGASNTAGAQPGGGGGMRPGTSTGGAGGAGRIIVTCW